MEITDDGNVDILPGQPFDNRRDGLCRSIIIHRHPDQFRARPGQLRHLLDGAVDIRGVSICH